MLYKNLSRVAWKESVHNPIKMLRDLAEDVYTSALQDDPEYISRYSAIMNRFRSEMDDNESWFSREVDGASRQPIAYFSAEYGLHRSLPFYADGLGFLAGDYLKECSDLGIPLVAVGFMYPEGYILQRMREDGWQQNVDDVLDRDSVPITRVLGVDGAQLVIEVPFIQPAIITWATRRRSGVQPHRLQARTPLWCRKILTSSRKSYHYDRYIQGIQYPGLIPG